MKSLILILISITFLTIINLNTIEPSNQVNLNQDNVSKFIISFKSVR